MRSCAPKISACRPRSSACIVGKLSGRAALNAQLKELGYDLTPEQLARAFPLVKVGARQKEGA